MLEDLRVTVALTYTLQEVLVALVKLQFGFMVILVELVIKETIVLLGQQHLI